MKLQTPNQMQENKTEGEYLNLKLVAALLFIKYERNICLYTLIFAWMCNMFKNTLTKLRRLGVRNRLIDDSDSKPSEFEH